MHSDLGKGCSSQRVASAKGSWWEQSFAQLGNKNKALWLQQSEGEGSGVLKEIQVWETMVKSMDFILRSVEN